MLGQGGTALTDLPDVERVEVLRGPQGTLFGKNASAGVVNIVSRNPTDEFTAELRTSFATPHDEMRHSLLISGPLIDNELGFVISGRYNERDGIVENFDGRELNDEKNFGFAASSAGSRSRASTPC